MAMKDFEFKKFMVQKGERVALGVAGFLMLLLILFNVKSFLNAGPKKNADVLEKMTKDLNGKLASNVPTKESDKPGAVEDSLGSFNFNFITDPSEFVVSRLFMTQEPLDMNRRQPELLTPVEGKIAFVQAQTMSYILQKNEKTGKLEVKVRLDSTATTGGTPMAPMGNAARKNDNIKFSQKFAGGPRGRPGSFSPPLGGRGFSGNDPNSRLLTGVGEDVKTEWVSVESLGEKEGATLMKTIRPVRMAEIVASFPYKAEVDEFRRKLRKQSLRDVLEEASDIDAEDTDDAGAVSQPRKLEAFRFLGIVVERRLVDSQGKVIYADAGPYKNGWEPLDVVGEYKPLLVLSNMQTQEEDPELDEYGLMPDGLVMQRLLSLREDQYPKIETELPTIQKTLAAMKKETTKAPRPASVKETTKDTIVAVQRNFDPDNFNPFSKGKSDTPNTGTNPMSPRGPGNPAMTMKPSGGRNFGMPAPRSGPAPGNGPMGGVSDNFLVPDYCLIRVIDVTVKPGESYQYRLRVRMANPNYGLQDRVADPNFADKIEANKDLKPNPDKLWFEIPGFVTVPTEMHIYALDQKELDRGSYNGGYRDAKVSRDQTVLQIHKYLDSAAPSKGKNVPIGEWSVAERVVVTRGEVIDRPVRVKVPILAEELGEFKLASTLVSSEKGASRDPGIDVRFEGVPGRPEILVDFDSNQQRYKRAGGEEITERPAQEVLILGSDGRLLAHNTYIDATDKASEEDLKNGKEGRIDRYEAWKKRIDELEKAPLTDPTGISPTTKPKGNPFDRGGPTTKPPGK